MPFVRRSPTGEIAAVSQSAEEGFSEELPADDTALNRFLRQLQPRPLSIEITDQGFIRVLEDVIDLLVEKELFSLDELPEDAREKIFLRRRLRGQLHTDN